MVETRKAAFMFDSYIQEIIVVGCLEVIGLDGVYAVTGFKHPVYVEEVTPYGDGILSEEYPEMVFFTGSDGVRRCAMETGRFI